MKTHHDARSVVLTGFTLFPFTVPQTYTYTYIHTYFIIVDVIAAALVTIFLNSFLF